MLPVGSRAYVPANGKPFEGDDSADVLCVAELPDRKIVMLLNDGTHRLSLNTKAACHYLAAMNIWAQLPNPNLKPIYDLEAMKVMGRNNLWNSAYPQS